ncbi:MAG: 1,4-dihydroxy-2-naphthoate polyprenyltransferase [Cytophagaceae bacterium]|nr:1,4-dihydroxy-2-naphthoate polyprenyltransferase [Cytophagaceae bacterium]MDW8457238.1 1,4-dihydroxy-2-naphthoate polyprenyltransferase [Cytophagaceae bacterium]
MNFSKINAWLKAFRLRTLPLSAASIGMGGFMAACDGSFQLSIFCLALLTTFLLQILSNLANDYGDYVSGADLIERIGPKRMLQSGQLKKNEMLIAIVIFTLLSLCSGVFLLIMSEALESVNAFGFFLALGILAIVASIKYTAGKNPYGYAGLGDLSVLIFFGFTGVLGSYYLHTQKIYPALLLPAASVGFLSVAVLNINNMRDMHSDKKAGKYTIPVRIGLERAKIYHAFLIICPILFSTVFVGLTFKSLWQFLYLISVPFLFINLIKIFNTKEAEKLDPWLRQLVFTTLLYTACFGIGHLLH